MAPIAYSEPSAALEHLSIQLTKGAAVAASAASVHKALDISKLSSTECIELEQQYGAHK
jgi:hypothetical protein